MENDEGEGILLEVVNSKNLPYARIHRIEIVK